MSYEVLARKWRPQIFQDVVGQEHITKTLINAIRFDRLAHAYLFSGPRGVGKTTVARILAKAITCERGEPGTPCNDCPSCVEITNGSSVDVQEIDGASNRRIEEVRELRENIKYLPSTGKYRIYIIDEVHMLTKEAFNALLKTLEEPPSHAKFIFATTETHKVPVTILSRCQRFDFKRIPPALIVKHLERITEEEKIDISRSALSLIAKEAEGSMRDAQSLLDQVVSFSGKDIDDRQVIDILGIIDADIILRAASAVIDGAAVDCLGIVDEIYNYGYDIKEFYRAFIQHFRNLLISLMDFQDDLLDMSDVEREELRHQAEKMGMEKVQFVLNFLLNREKDLVSTTHPRLLMETFMIKLCHIDDFLSFDDLLRKIESLENRLLGHLHNTPLSSHENDSAPDTDSQESEDPNKTCLERDDQSPPVKSKSWEGFLSFLSSRNRVMYNMLKSWNMLSITENRVDLSAGNGHFAANYFNDRERFAQLSKYCREFFERDVKVKIVADSSNISKPGVTSGDSKKKKTDISSSVQDIIDIFHGEIKQITPDRD